MSFPFSLLLLFLKCSSFLQDKKLSRLTKSTYVALCKNTLVMAPIVMSAYLMILLPLVALALITLQKYLIHTVSFMLSVCPDLRGSFYYSRPGRGSSHFVAYSSCYCSLSALWDACLDPPWHVTLELTLSMRLTAGSPTSPCVSVSLPLPSLSVRCSSPSISASARAVEVFTLSDLLNHVSLKNASCRLMNLLQFVTHAMQSSCRG